VFLPPGGCIVQLEANRTFPYIDKRAQETLQPINVDTQDEAPTPLKQKRRIGTEDDSTVSESSVRDLLLSLISSNVDIDPHVSRLKRNLAKLSPTMTAELLASLSKEIVDRIPSGQHWGSSQPQTLEGQGETYAYKLVQLVVSQKHQQHQALLDILQAAVCNYLWRLRLFFIF
jgi:hypothetical protein